LSVPDVLKLHTANAPAGDLAELLVGRATGGEFADNS